MAQRSYPGELRVVKQQYETEPNLRLSTNNGTYINSFNLCTGTLVGINVMYFIDNESKVERSNLLKYLNRGKKQVI